MGAVDFESVSLLWISGSEPLLGFKIRHGVEEKEWLCRRQLQ
jgi:hypothetical protein